MTLQFAIFTCYLILVANHQLVPDGPLSSQGPFPRHSFWITESNCFQVMCFFIIAFLIYQDTNENRLFSFQYFSKILQLHHVENRNFRLRTTGWSRQGWKQWMMECRSIQDLNRTFCSLKHSWRCEDHVHYQIRGHCSNKWMYGLAIMPIHSSLC